MLFAFGTCIGTNKLTVWGSQCFRSVFVLYGSSFIQKSECGFSHFLYSAWNFKYIFNFFITTAELLKIDDSKEKVFSLMPKEAFVLSTWIRICIPNSEPNPEG